MVIFLYGPDDYRREAKKREIVAEFQKRHSNLGLGTYDLSIEGDFEMFLDFLKNQSLFQSAKMAVLENSFEAADGKIKELKRVLQEVVDNKSITVLISEKDKPVKALDFLLKKPVRQIRQAHYRQDQGVPVLAQEFEVLKGKEWESFVRGEVKKREINISPDGVRFLAQVYEGDTWRLVTELDKIQFLGGPSTGSGQAPSALRQSSGQAGSGLSREIQIKDLEDLGVEQAPNFWGLILGFKSRDVAARLWALEKVFGLNEPPAKIFNILAYQLPDKLQDLARYDLMVKSGKIEYEEVLVDLALK